MSKLNRAQGGALYLQVRAQEGLPLGVLVVVSHEQVEQRRSLGPQDSQFGDTAFEHLAAHVLAQRHAALKHHRRELGGGPGGNSVLVGGSKGSCCD